MQVCAAVAAEKIVYCIGGGLQIECPPKNNNNNNNNYNRSVYDCNKKCNIRLN